ncbi:hypothetical protein GCM10023223_32760 [Stackebrandtia albiflava]
MLSYRGARRVVVRGGRPFQRGSACRDAARSPAASPEGVPLRARRAGSDPFRASRFASTADPSWVVHNAVVIHSPARADWTTPPIRFYAQSMGRRLEAPRSLT